MNEHFTEVEVIEHLVKAYKEAGKPTYPHENLYRGRNHSISGIGEDLLGAYLISRLEGVQIFIDQPLSMIDKSLSTRYPDLLICEDNVIKNMLEVKMDLGYQRKDFINYCQKKEEWISNIVGKQCVLSRKREDRIPMNIADDIKFHIVIYSENNGPKRFDEEIMPIIKETCPHIEVYVLTSGQHPNLANVDLEGININKDEFERLVNEL
ncbi:hypothetical protein MUA27_00395 [Mammaliicoccus sciuri]|uniref:hypothetical protein n=1 Tax=Mammaliicoccus sciuri TaxID=1296 RepID=UPI000BBE5521|nr:hypothetical protein [Mammaliicoccus sciuri]PCM41081.1 hypothetical protein CPU09_06775 [Mammaliicoccus sciuri]UXU78125.1 hypothetical protein MUA27_00395 [Mammaliicoccus sciuri]